MAENADDPQLFWIEPEYRGILPLEEAHLPRRLARTVRQQNYEIRVDSDFSTTISGCAEARSDRPSTWINSKIKTLYQELFEMGHCHTVEAWQDGQMVGGLYGIHLAGAFFGESMFSTERDASKVALAYLIARLKAGGFVLLDTQFITNHLRQFGTVEIERDAFLVRLEEAMQHQADVSRRSPDTSPDDIVEIIRTGGT